MPKQVSTAVMRVIKSVLNQSVLSTSLTTSQFASFAFTLQNNFGDETSSIATLYDQYRCVMVEVDILPSASENLAAVATLTSGTYFSVIDYDDATNLTTVQKALDYPNVLIRRSYEKSTRTLVPRAAIAAYSGVFTSFANVAGLWYDMASTGVQYYGVKLAAPSSSTSIVFDAVVRTLWEFRNPR